MKKTFKIGTGIFGEGQPKICVPIVAKNRNEIWKKAEEIAALSVDIVEWRADFYEKILREDDMFVTLQGIKERLGDKALLFTFRTKGEGGNRSIEKTDYYRLNQNAAASGCVDLVDVEIYLDEERAAGEIQRIQTSGSRVIASSHDFEKTPPVEEMVSRLRHMEEAGANIAKLAVMPNCKQDVLNLLQATITADEVLSVPVVTMSMGKMGVISRICGNLSGSAITFAAVGETSAPGQIPARQMKELLEAQL